MCFYAMLCYANANELPGCCLAAAYQLMEIIFYGFGVKVVPFWDQFLVLLEAVGSNFGTLGSRCPPGDFQDPPGSV